MNIRRKDCRIVGGMRAARGGAAFARAPLVVECHGQRYIVGRIGHGEAIEGEPITDEEWHGVLASEEALKFSERHETVPNAFLWLLRRNFSFRTEAMNTLEQRNAVLHRETTEGAFVVLVDESAASGLTDEWAGRAFNQAWKLAEAEKLREAVEDAELAVDLARSFQVDYVALVCLLYERLGDKDRAEAMLEFIRNSRGSEFYERAREKKTRFAEELSTVVSASAPFGQRPAARMHARRGRAVDASFGSLRREARA